jgi:predicted nucleic acid-binding Zn ribbon protein
MSTWRPARPPRAEREPAPVTASLERLARRLGAPAPDVLTAVFARWDELVGPQVALHARPRSLRGGVLTVVVDDPAWATQLRLLSAELLARLATAAPDPAAVRELRVVVRPRGA